MELKHIYWFAHFNLSCPSTRYRGKYALEYVKEKKQISSDFVYPASDLKNIIHFLTVYLKVLFFRKKNSIIVFQKIRTNRFYGRMLKFLLFARNKNTIYDIDDAEYLRFPKEIIDHYIKHSHYVITGGTVLEDYCRKLNKNIFISTSPVTEHSFSKTQRNTKPVIGWVGDYGNGNEIEKEYSHKSSLNSILFPAIAQLKFELKLVLIGVKEKEDIPEIKKYFQSYPHVELDIPENLSWEDDRWLYKKICEFDLGVSPILDFEFNRAKSAFKAKQYLSCGIPTIASNVGENSTFVNTSNGFICDSVNDYVSAITSITNYSKEDYQKLSDNAYNCKGSFSMQLYCEKLIGMCKTMNQ